MTTRCKCGGRWLKSQTETGVSFTCDTCGNYTHQVTRKAVLLYHAVCTDEASKGDVVKDNDNNFFVFVKKLAGIGNRCQVRAIKRPKLKSLEGLKNGTVSVWKRDLNVSQVQSTKRASHESP